MTIFQAALKLSIDHAESLGVKLPEQPKDRCHGDEVNAPEHAAFILNLHHDLREENDFSLDPITAAGSRDNLTIK